MNISTRNHVNDSQKLSLTCLLRRILLGTRDYSLIVCKKSRRATSQVTQICPYYVCHVECRARRGDVDLSSLIDDRQQQYREKFCIKHSWNVEHTPFWHIKVITVRSIVWFQFYRPSVEQKMLVSSVRQLGRNEKNHSAIILQGTLLSPP